MVYIGYLLTGLCAGLIGGAFGVGGGIIMVPVLIILFKQSVYVAVGTSLMVIIAISISGTLKHWTLDNVNFQIALFLAIGGVIGSLVGASLLESIPPIYAKRALAVILIYSAFRLWFVK